MSARATATDRLSRLLALVPWVAAHPDGVGVDEVCQRFEVDRAQLVSDLNTVMMVGVYPFTPDTMIEAWVEDDQVMIHYAEAFARPLRLTADEAVTLIAAIAAVKAVPGGEVNGPLERAAAKLAGVVGGGETSGVEVQLGAASGEIFSVLDRARREGEQVVISYPDGDSGAVATRKIEPAQVFSSSGRWYVAAWCHRAEDSRVFRLDRILEATATGESFIADAAGEIGQTLAFGESAPQVELAVDRDAAWMLDAVPALTRQDSGGEVRVRLAIGSPTWLARLLVQLGPQARVIQADPALSIGDLARNEAARILERYR